VSEETYAVCQQESRRLADDVETALEEIDTIQAEIYDIGSTRRLRGKSLEDWDSEFRISFDYQATPVHVNMMLQKLAENLDRANKFCDQAKYERAIFKTHYGKEKRSKIEAEAARKGKKTPSLETMTTLAESALGSKTVVKEYYDFEIDYWEKKIWKIRNQIEIANILTMSNGTKYKIGEPNL
jgi:hypothetical protein